LDGPCNEWEACVTQDASAIMKVQISARNVAEIMNEFVGVLTFKTWVSHRCHPSTAVVSQQLTIISRASFSRSSWWQSSLATSALVFSANPRSPTQRSRQSLCTRRRQSPHVGVGRSAQSPASLYLGAPQPDAATCSEELLCQRS
jgi:hypothetical protein